MRRLIPTLIVFACAAGFICGTADAAMIAYIADDALVTGGGDTIVTDQGVGDNFPGSAIVGQINSGAVSVGGFTIISNIAQSKPLIGSAASPTMSLTFSAVTNDNASHTAYLYVSDTGFTGTGNFDLALGGSQPGAGSNSLVGSAWGGNTNTNLDLTRLLATTGSTSTSPFALVDDGAFAPIVNPYGLTIGVAITRTTAGTTTGSLSLTPVPEPAAFLALAPALAFALRRRRNG